MTTAAGQGIRNALHDRPILRTPAPGLAALQEEMRGPDRVSPRGGPGPTTPAACVTGRELSNTLDKLAREWRNRSAEVSAADVERSRTFLPPREPSGFFPATDPGRDRLLAGDISLPRSFCRAFDAMHRPESLDFFGELRNV
jgi:hypothetical protein